MKETGRDEQYLDSRKVGVSVAQVYLAKHRVSALVKKESRQLEKQLI